MRVLITGASRGIGQALCRQYQASGAEVLATARRPVPGLLPLDVTDAASVSALSARLPEPLDLLICNAGVLLDRGQSLATGYPPQLWADSFATNVTGVFLTVQAFLPQLRAARGKIAILSSQMGSDARAPGGSYAYRASKAAVLNLGRNLASDLRPEGIAVGIYHPGWVQTDMGGKAAEVTAEESARGLAARIDELTAEDSGCFRDFRGTTLPF